MKLTTYLLVAVMTIGFFSCKKEKNKDCAINESNFAGSYKISSVKYKATSSSPEIDGSSFIDACAIDDVSTFKSDHTYTYVDGGTKCNPPGDGTGTWSLSGSTLTVDGNGTTVSNFTCSNFTVTTNNVFSPGDMLLITFARQ